MSVPNRPATQTPAAHAADAAKGPLVLVIEPDNLTRWSIQAYLCSHCRVTPVRSVRSALEMLSTCTPDMIVLSDALPSEQTTELIRHARQRNASLRIVQLVSDLHALLSEPGVIVLEKPFALARLAELLPGLGHAPNKPEPD